MKIHLKCFASLVNPDTCDYKDSTEYELTEGQTIENLVKKAGVDMKDLKIAFVNGRIVEVDTVLKDGDQVGLAPAVGGM
jgi:molybdopterin converting factor small subunit